VEVGSITGEVSLLWRERDRYDGEVLLLTLDPDDPLAQSTFEVRGALAGRLDEDALSEGMRVRVDLRSETVEVVNQETGETEDRARPVVVDVVVLVELP
jgi:hypothetical protein